MDTRWFAVDADGHVGLFDTGEDGALPSIAANLGGPAEPNFETRYYYAAAIARQVADGAYSPAGRWQEVILGSGQPQHVLVIAEHTVNDVHAVDFEVVCSKPWSALSRRPLSADELRWLAGVNGVLDVLREEDFHDAVESDSRSLFEFSRQHGDDPGRYQRWTVPTKPLHIEELPRSAREAIGSLRLPVTFASTRELHLGDFMGDSDAYYWGNWTLRGFVRPPANPRFACAVVVLAVVFAAGVVVLLTHLFGQHW